jgi:hypothetical protein
MTTKIYDPKRCCPIQYESYEKGRVWFGRHIGIVLKFGSNGGNFTRNFKSNAEWKKMFRKGRDYIELPAMFPKGGGHAAIWLTDRGLVMSLQQVMRERAQKDDIEGASEVSKFVQWLMRETPLKANLFPKAAKKITRPMKIVEEVLGAGLAVRYNEYGIYEFVFLDQDDGTHILAADDLDKGWQEKLRKALGPGPWR